MGEKGNRVTQIVRTMRSILRENARDIPKGSERSKKLLQPLLKKLKGFKARDLGMRPPCLPSGFPPKAVGFLPVWEEKDFEISIFAFPPGAKIPLHDHPGMCVISQILYGSLQARSYDMDRKNGEVIRQDSKTLSEAETSVLFENEGNIHEFVAGEQGCAVLDIITPLYDEMNGRPCTYYKEEMKNGKTLLKRIGQPLSFRTYRVDAPMDSVEGRDTEGPKP
ncbi:hypothetical protein AAMO2058_000899300 [Amorphochlora amoebiformis]